MTSRYSSSKTTTTKTYSTSGPTTTSYTTTTTGGDRYSTGGDRYSTGGDRYSTSGYTTTNSYGDNYGSSSYSGEGRVISHAPTTVGERVPVKDSCGFISIKYAWDQHNLPQLHTYKSYSYQAVQGRDAWLRTYKEEQEWLRKLANGGVRAVPEPEPESEEEEEVVEY